VTSGELVDLGEAVLGREEAFRALANRRLESSYRLARAILHDPADAEDATHDAIVTAWRKWPSLREPRRFDHWFDRILVNTCRNRLRSRVRRGRSVWQDEEADRMVDPLRSLGEREAVRAAIGALSADHRLVVALRFYRDLTIPEIAELVGARPGTVKSRLHHALRRLHDHLDRADVREALR
jgi:RNA polymerase sigma-70 factor (ECF subfamily)